MINIFRAVGVIVSVFAIGFVVSALWLDHPNLPTISHYASHEYYELLPEKFADCGSYVQGRENNSDREDQYDCLISSFLACRPAKTHSTFYTIEGGIIMTTVFTELQQDSQCVFRIQNQSHDDFGRSGEFDVLCNRFRKFTKPNGEASGLVFLDCLGEEPFGI